MLRRMLLGAALIERVGHFELKPRDLRIKRLALAAHHPVGSVHGAAGCLENTATRVFEVFTRFEQWLLSHDTRPANLFDFATLMRNDPVAASKLRGLLALVGNANGVTEDITMFARRGLRWNVLR